MPLRPDTQRSTVTDGEANGKKIYFGWNDLWGEPQSWWIVGQDPADTEGNGLVLLSSTPLIHDQKFDSETDQFKEIPYDPAWGSGLRRRA